MHLHPNPLDWDSPWEWQWSLLHLLTAFSRPLCVSCTVCDGPWTVLLCSHTSPSLSVWFSFSLLTCCTLKQMFSTSFYICVLRVMVFIVSDTPCAGQTLNFSILFNQCSVLLFTPQSQYFLHKLFDPFLSPLADSQPCSSASSFLIRSSSLFHTAFHY